MNAAPAFLMNGKNIMSDERGPEFSDNGGEDERAKWNYYILLLGTHLQALLDLIYMQIRDAGNPFKIDEVSKEITKRNPEVIDKTGNGTDTEEI